MKYTVLMLTLAALGMAGCGLKYDLYMPPESEEPATTANGQLAPTTVTLLSTQESAPAPQADK